MFEISWPPCFVTLRMAALRITEPPALAYKGALSGMMLTIVPELSPLPVPTANCCSSPTVSPLAFTIEILITPSVSVSTWRLAGTYLYAPPVEKASPPFSCGSSLVSTFEPPAPPNSCHKDASPKSDASPLNCLVSHVFSPVLYVITSPLLAYVIPLSDCNFVIADMAYSRV